jgi:hypothetical protein
MFLYQGSTGHKGTFTSSLSTLEFRGYRIFVTKFFPDWAHILEFYYQTGKAILYINRQNIATKQADVIRREFGMGGGGVFKSWNKKGTRCLDYRKLGHALNPVTQPKFLPAGPFPK